MGGTWSSKAGGIVALSDMTSAPAGGTAKAMVAKVSRGEKAARVRESMEPEKCRAELGGAENPS